MDKDDERSEKQEMPQTADLQRNRMYYVEFSAVFARHTQHTRCINVFVYVNLINNLVMQRGSGRMSS